MNDDDILADVSEGYGAVDRRLDIGSDLELLWVRENEFIRLRLRHRCDRAQRNAGVIICAPEISFEAGRHSVDNLDSAELTISPSILCDDCGLHGYVRGGKWTTA